MLCIHFACHVFLNLSANDQLISKCLLVSLILPNNERKQLELRYHSSEVEFFRCFLEELKIPKRHFEIN